MAQAVEPLACKSCRCAQAGSQQPYSMLAAELNRSKEPLEAYPLDSMSMWQRRALAAVPFALLRVDNLLSRSRWVTTWARTTGA